MHKKTAVEDLGEWYPFSKDPKTGTVLIEWRIRRLPAAIARQLRRQKVKIKNNVTTVDVAAEELRQREEALACWTGSRGLAMTADDDGAQKLYEKYCPGVSFPIGQDVVVDGCLTDALKRDILTDYPECVDFIRKRAKQLQAVSDEEEDEAQGN